MKRRGLHLYRGFKSLRLRITAHFWYTGNMDSLPDTLRQVFPDPEHVLVNITADGITMIEWVTPVSEAFLEASSDGEYQVTVIPFNGEPFSFNGNVNDLKILEDAVHGFLRPSPPAQTVTVEIAPGLFLEHRGTT